MCDVSLLGKVVHAPCGAKSHLWKNKRARPEFPPLPRVPAQLGSAERAGAAVVLAVFQNGSSVDYRKPEGVEEAEEETPSDPRA